MASRKKASTRPAPLAPPTSPKPFFELLPGDDEQLSRGPSAAAEALRRAARETLYTSVVPHVTAAFDALGFPKGKVYAPVATLTDGQRELARFVTDRKIPSTGFAMPAYQWCREGWLEGGRALDQPMEIEVGGTVRVEPIWRALQIAGEAGQIGPAVVDELPLATLLEVFVELCVEQKGYLVEYVGPWPLGRAFVEPAVARVTRELKEDHAAWATQAADRLLGIEREPQRSIPNGARWPVFLALVRGHVSIDARWDHLVPIGIRELEEPMLECARAIPDERRAAALVKALGRTGGEAGEQGALVLMRTFSSAEVTEWLHGFNANNQAVRKRYVEGLVQEIAKKDSVVAAAWRKLEAGQPARLTLRCKDVFWPGSAGELAPMQRKQLEKAGKLYDRRKLTAEQRLSEDPQLADPKNEETVGSFRGYIDVSVICDEHGKELYDAFVYMVDAGTIFERNKLKVVAELVQGGATGCEPALRDALDVALHGRARRAVSG